VKAGRGVSGSLVSPKRKKRRLFFFVELRGGAFLCDSHFISFFFLFIILKLNRCFLAELRYITWIGAGVSV